MSAHRKTNAMNDHYSKVRNYVQALDYELVYEDETDGLLVIDNPSEGIQNMMLVIAPPILVVEQYLVDVATPTVPMLTNILQKNRQLVHGAMVLNETGDKLLFRDTQELENLDLNELEASINALSLLLAEFSSELIDISPINSAVEA